MPALEAASKVNIIKDALLLIGEQEIQSLTDDSFAVQVAVRRFEPLYEDLLTKSRWRFAAKKATLSRLVAEPLNEWSYAYQLPGDLCLIVKTDPMCDYEVYGDTIYANASALDLDYIYKPEVGDLPPYFSLLLTYRCAFEWARPVTEGASRKEELRVMYMEQLNAARYADSQGRPNAPFSDSPFTVGREDWR